VLVGTLLGDGCLARHGRYHRLHVKHKRVHMGLAEFKRDVFASYVSMPLHEFDQRLEARSYPAVQFATRTSPAFSEWHRRFYGAGGKIVPLDIDSLLTPLAVAVWFMDDGAADYAGVTLQTHGFTFQEVTLLEKALQVRYRLETNSRRNKGRRLLYIRAASVVRLEELIGPHLLEEFRYKLVPRRSRTP
jgi:hypothetical protein